MSDSNNKKNERGEEQTLNQQEQPKQEQQQSTTSDQNIDDIFSNMKMGQILDFDSNNQLNIDQTDAKLQSYFEGQKQERENIELLQEKLMRETISLGLHKKKVNGKLLKIVENNSSTQENNISSDSEPLSKKLEKKWGLDQINETEEEKAFMKDLLDKTSVHQPESMFNKQNLPQSEKEAREKYIAQNLYQPQKRKNITEYNARYSHEIDPMMQGSHLDVKNEDTPKMMRYMDEFREFKPQINIGERWGQIIQNSAISRIQYEQQIAKGGSLVSYMAKTGKLGIDLYFIVFGITAVFFIPYMVHQHQKQKINYIQKTKNINPKTVPDFYYSEYDLDEISIQKSFYNQYTEEIMEEKNKKLKLHKEIQSLTNMLYANK